MKIEELVNKYYGNLNQTDLHIIKIIMNNTIDMKKMKIEDLAEKCNTSRTSVLRMTKKLGFSGYSEFKNVIKWEKDIVQAPLNLAASVLMDDLNKTSKFLFDNEQLTLATNYIKKAKRVFVYGTGQAQRYCAQELQRLFMQVEVYFYVMHATEEFQLAVKNLTTEDVVIIISLSGNVVKIDTELKLLDVRNIPVISITNFTNNNLAGFSTCGLYVMNTPIQLDEDTEHHSFVHFLLVVELLFRKYLELYVDVE